MSEADRARRVAERMAGDITSGIASEILLARTNLGLSARAAARLAGVSPTTYALVERGAASVRLGNVCRVAAALGLKVWAKSFPVREPRLRDTGQLRLADTIRRIANDSYRFRVEFSLGNGRSIDAVLFGADEIVAIEIYRLLADFQAQYRAAVGKRDELAQRHQRPVRLVIVVEDTRRNRLRAAEHVTVISAALPARSREVLRALRRGSLLHRDGILWLRP